MGVNPKTSLLLSLFTKNSAMYNPNFQQKIKTVENKKVDSKSISTT